MDLYQIVVDQCAMFGGPTERCQRIYRALESSRGWYWRAVQEGMNRYRAKRNVSKAALQKSQLTSR